jgi:glycosyltransferase involved in cell wall biosynthesis
MIAKNEEKNLPRCLENLKPYGFEIVVVDTGSTDRTREIALEFGAKLFEFAWVNDFSAARNFAAAQASNNWVFALDCDEYIQKINVLETLKLMKQYPRCVGVLDIENEMLDEENSDGTPRAPGTSKRTYTTQLVRLYPRKRFHFVGEIHEQVLPLSGDTEEMVCFDAPIKLYHTGYVGTPEQIAAKNKRNIELLLAAIEKDPEDAYNYFQLGQCCVLGGDYAGACEWFGKGLSFDLEPTLEYVQTMVGSYGQSLLGCGRKEEALNFTGIYEAFSPLADFVYLMGRIYLANDQPLKALGEFLKVITMTSGKQQGVTTFLPFYQIATIYDQMDNMEIAIMYYKKSGDFAPARKRLEELGFGS